MTKIDVLKIALDLASVLSDGGEETATTFWNLISRKGWSMMSSGSLLI